MDTWRRCSSCKADIGFDSAFWECSVSTCTRPRTGFFFCSVSCWEAHLPTMRHREAWAVEKRSPTREQWERMGDDAEAAGDGDGDDSEISDRSEERTAVETPRRRVVAAEPTPADDDLPREVLIVVSKLKKYIKARSGMNTSDNVVGPLSDYVRRLCDVAIRKAGEEGRKTVLDRDFRNL